MHGWVNGTEPALWAKFHGLGVDGWVCVHIISGHADGGLGEVWVC